MLRRHGHPAGTRALLCAVPVCCRRRWIRTLYSIDLPPGAVFHRFCYSLYYIAPFAPPGWHYCVGCAPFCWREATFLAPFFSMCHRKCVLSTSNSASNPKKPVPRWPLRGALLHGRSVRMVQGTSRGHTGEAPTNTVTAYRGQRAVIKCCGMRVYAAFSARDSRRSIRVTTLCDAPCK